MIGVDISFANVSDTDFEQYFVHVFFHQINLAGVGNFKGAALNFTCFF